jgi:hypothetical protein
LTTSSGPPGSDPGFDCAADKPRRSILHRQRKWLVGYKSRTVRPHNPDLPHHRASAPCPLRPPSSTTHARPLSLPVAPPNPHRHRWTVPHASPSRVVNGTIPYAVSTMRAFLGGAYQRRWEEGGDGMTRPPAGAA